MTEEYLVASKAGITVFSPARESLGVDEEAF